MGWVGEAVRDAVFVANPVENMAKCPPPDGAYCQIAFHCPSVSYVLVRQGRQRPAQEFSGQHLRGPRVQFGEGHLAGAVDGHEQVALTFFSVDFRKIDV